MVYTKPEPGTPILIELGGQMLEIRFTLRTLKALAADHSLAILGGTALLAIFQDPDKLSIILTYGLKSRNPEITAEWVEDNVDASMLLDLAPMLVYATTGRWPDMQKLEAAVPNVESPLVQ